MHESRLISDSILSEYYPIISTSHKLHALYLQQTDTWELAKKNFSDLNLIKKKKIDFNGIEIIVQFNPGRIISSSAAVDSKSISERPCFLCTANLPSEQRGILYNDNYIFLLNPFPIFSEHFTIPKLSHSPQSIINNFKDMLLIAKDLNGKYSLFYNGPKCGASAPDHMHFQASPFNSMPLEYQFELIKNNSTNISKNKKIALLKVENYLRNLFVIESSDLQITINYFEKLYQAIAEKRNSQEEPLLNIIVSYSGKWKVFIFPRKAHRPRQYFAEDDSKLLLSPAAVDFGGIFITPRKEDFEKITAGDIKDIFSQTGIDKNTFNEIANSIIL